MFSLSPSLRRVPSLVQSRLRRARQRLDRAEYLTRSAPRAALLLAAGRFWHSVLGRVRDDDGNVAPARPILETIAGVQRLWEQDLQDLDDAVYPRSVVFDLPPLPFLRRLAADGLPEMARMIRAREGGAFALDVDATEREAYPPYYLRKFHWQSDGWLSARSARLYDQDIELLFLGATDAIRRRMLRPLVEALATKPLPRILDVACGTGRLTLSIARALPHARVTGLDLSGHYLAHARAVVGDAPHVSFVEDDAAHMPFRDATFDAVTCCFLFHELPRDVRRDVVREMKRVLKPGGVVVLCDAFQAGDLPDDDANDGQRRAFSVAYHEPYFESFWRDDLVALAREVGLTVDRSAERWWVAKVVTASTEPVAAA